MSFRFSCPECGKCVEVDELASGAWVSCPHCKKRILAPSEAGFRFECDHFRWVRHEASGDNDADCDFTRLSCSKKLLTFTVRDHDNAHEGVTDFCRDCAEYSGVPAGLPPHTADYNEQCIYFEHFARRYTHIQRPDSGGNEGFTPGRTCYDALSEVRQCKREGGKCFEFGQDDVEGTRRGAFDIHWPPRRLPGFTKGEASFCRGCRVYQNSADHVTAWQRAEATKRSQQQESERSEAERQQQLMAAKRKAATPVQVRVHYAGKWMLVDSSLEVALDDRVIARGSVKRGLDQTVQASPGAHELRMVIAGKRIKWIRKSRVCTVDITAGYDHDLELTYSRVTGTLQPLISRREVPA